MSHTDDTVSAAHRKADAPDPDDARKPDSPTDLYQAVLAVRRAQDRSASSPPTSAPTSRRP